MSSARGEVRTTVTVPPVAGPQVERVDLLRRLDAWERAGGGVLAVSAPAGFGKTTLVADWARRMLARGQPVAWVDLDAADGTPSRFWTVVLAALDQVGESARPHLVAPPAADDEDFRARLVMRLAAGPKLVLVIDNLQLINDRGALRDLDRLVDHLPERVGLVLSSRSDPALPTLHRLKLAGRLARLRADDLAFTLDEVALLCAGASADVIASTWRRTEGWPALVRMVQLSGGGERWLRDTSIDDRALADYLFHETFLRQDEPTRHVLMVCAVPREVPIALATRLSGTSAAGGVLDRVAERSGLVVRHPLPDGQGISYRFHPMLREYLRGLLVTRDHGAAAIAHAVAARWFGQEGWRLDAVEHALLSGDREVEEEILRSCGPTLINAGEAELLLGVMTRGPRATERQLGPWARTVLAAAMEDVGRTREAASTLSALDPAVADDTATVLAKAIASKLSARDDLEGLDRFTSVEDPHICDPDLRLMLACRRGSTLARVGRADEAERELRVGLDLADGLGRSAARLDCLTALGSLAAGRTDIGSTARLAVEALELADESGATDAPKGASIRLLAGFAAWQQLDAASARVHIDLASRALDPRCGPVTVAAVEALDALLEHERTGAVEPVDRLRAWWERHGEDLQPASIAYAAPAGVRLSLSAHRWRWASDVQQIVAMHLPGSGEHHLVGAMLAEAGGHRARARRLLTEASDAGESGATIPGTWLEVGALAARLALRDGDKAQAVKIVRQVLPRLAALGTLRQVVDGGGDEVITLLRSERGRWGTEEPVVQLVLDRADGGGDLRLRLTDRELEVLRELPSLRTVEQIGTDLFLSANTVKTHLRGVYRKLDVRSRREAVGEARRLGLL